MVLNQFLGGKHVIWSYVKNEQKPAVHTRFTIQTSEVEEVREYLVEQLIYTVSESYATLPKVVSTN